MTPSRFWVSYGVVALAVTAGSLLLTALDPPRWWPFWCGMLASVAVGTYAVTVLHNERPFTLPQPHLLRHGIAPLALAAGGSLFAHEFLGGQFGLVAAVATAAGTAAVMYCEAALSDPQPGGQETLQLISHLSVWVSAFLLFAALQSLTIPAPWGMLLLGLLGGLLASEVFHDANTAQSRQLLYGGLVTLLIAEMGWSMSFLPWGKVLTGLILLLAFYVLSGLIHNHLQERLTKWVALEFLGVTAVALLLVYRFHGLGG